MHNKTETEISFIFLAVGPDLEQNADKMVIKVNVPPEIKEMIQEALHLEQMGYRISEKIRNIALLRDVLIHNSRMLTQILDNYYAVRRKIRPHEVCSTILFLKYVMN
jgi:hypothetical protein